MVVLESPGKGLVWSGKFYCILGQLSIEFFTLTIAAVSL